MIFEGEDDLEPEEIIDDAEASLDLVANRTSIVFGKGSSENLFLLMC